MHVLGAQGFKFIIFNDGDSNGQEPNYKLVIIYKCICSENTGISKSLGSHKDYGQLERRGDERKSTKHHVCILKGTELGYFPLRSWWKIIDLSPVNLSLSSCKDRSNNGQNGGRRWPVSPEYAVMQGKLPLIPGSVVYLGLHWIEWGPPEAGNLKCKSHPTSPTWTLTGNFNICAPLTSEDV